MLEGFSLGNYLLLVEYTGRLFREGKAVISGELAGVFERLGSKAENAQETRPPAKRIAQDLSISQIRTAGKCSMVELPGYPGWIGHDAIGPRPSSRGRTRPPSSRGCRIAAGPCYAQSRLEGKS